MHAVISAIEYLLIQMAMSGEMLLFVLALIVIMGFFVIPFIADKLTWRTAQEEEWVKAAMANLQRAISDNRTAIQ
ncbi:hypothetical protein AWB81_06428 [Caballeronia arationis]|uniref:hypothetical protein n=1 Tax=Caballeronia arationis TaxID=1777142 RepID=UPI00074BBDA6|nr:hypothetical protein [Caballeronia arationis]SAL03482.1 hypothetical protein AWB81_06428 [Caballeronia arationis]